jgi:hypothetical protein
VGRPGDMASSAHNYAVAAHSCQLIGLLLLVKEIAPKLSFHGRTSTVWGGVLLG